VSPPPRPGQHRDAAHSSRQRKGFLRQLTFSYIPPAQKRRHAGWRY
jgi:hypothetical protein